MNSMASSVCGAGSISEGFDFEFSSSEANNLLLTTLMEEALQDVHDDDEYSVGDDRLVSMIQSLEAEIAVGQVDGQHCSTSAVSDDPEDGYNNWMVDMEVASATLSSSSSSSSSSPFDEMMGAWSPCAAAGDHTEYYSEFYYGGFMEQQLRDTIYLPQEPSDIVFS